MKVDVNDVTHGEVVDVRSAIGTIRGCWKGASRPAGVVHIELTWTPVATLGENADGSNRQVYEASVNEHVTSLTGRVEEVDDDGIFYLRLASDCLVMVEGRPGDFHAGDWIKLRCAPRDLELYPF